MKTSMALEWCWSRGSPAAYGADDGEAAVPQWISTVEQISHGGPHRGAGGCLQDAVTLWEACAGAGSWPATYGEDPRWRGS